MEYLAAYLPDKVRRTAHSAEKPREPGGFAVYSFEGLLKSRSWLFLLDGVSVEQIVGESRRIADEL